MKQLSNKEMKIIKEKLNRYSLELKDDLAELDKDNIKIILQEKKPAFFFLEDKLIPTLQLLNQNNFLKTATIDMQAVRFIVGGADVMRPGIVAFDNFDKDEVIAVVDQKNRKPLAVGIALFSSEELKAMDKGKVIKNVHYIGDKVWTI